MSNPLVSYVVITRDRLAEVVECLANIEEQDYSRKEIVVVDNGSQDGTPDVLRERFPNAKVFAVGENLGVAGGRNRGIEESSGEFCVFIDDDARFESPTATREILKHFDDSPKLACLALRVENAFTGEEDVKCIPRRDKKVIATDYECAYFAGCGFALRQSAIDDVGVFWKPLIYGGEELDLAYRLIDASYELKRASAITVLHREAPDARPKGQWIYFNTRNRPWVAARHLPFVYVASTTLLWWTHVGLLALRRRQFWFFVRGVRDSIRGLPSAIQGRKRIRNGALCRLRDLSGRLWY